MKPLPPFGRHVQSILSDSRKLENFSGCTRERGTVWIATGPQAWDWHEQHPQHLSVVLPPGESPFSYRWSFMKGHGPALILPPVADDPEARRNLAAAILRDGVDSALACGDPAMRYAQG